MRTTYLKTEVTVTEKLVQTKKGFINRIEVESFHSLDFPSFNDREEDNTLKNLFKNLNN